MAFIGQVNGIDHLIDCINRLLIALIGGLMHESVINCIVIHRISRLINWILFRIVATCGTNYIGSAPEDLMKSRR